MRLRPPTVPPASETWRRLQLQLSDARRPRRASVISLRVVLAALAALMATAGIALASSPDLRQQLAAAVGMASLGNRVSSLQPPPFRVFQPTSLPDGLRLVAEATTARRIYSSDRAAAPRTPRKQGRARPDQRRVDACCPTT